MRRCDPRGRHCARGRGRGSRDPRSSPARASRWWASWRRSWRRRRRCSSSRPRSSSSSCPRRWSTSRPCSTSCVAPLLVDDFPEHAASSTSPPPPSAARAARREMRPGWASPRPVRWTGRSSGASTCVQIGVGPEGHERGDLGRARGPAAAQRGAVETHGQADGPHRERPGRVQLGGERLGDVGGPVRRGVVGDRQQHPLVAAGRPTDQVGVQPAHGRLQCGGLVGADDHQLQLRLAAGRSSPLRSGGAVGRRFAPWVGSWSHGRAFRSGSEVSKRGDGREAARPAVMVPGTAGPSLGGPWVFPQSRSAVGTGAVTGALAPGDGEEPPGCVHVHRVPYALRDEHVLAGGERDPPRRDRRRRRRGARCRSRRGPSRPRRPPGAPPRWSSQRPVRSS